MVKKRKYQTNVNFIKKLEEEVKANLKNEQFGVEELAERMSMSRSNLHRKLKYATGQSISQFIREYRLQRGMEYLENDELTVSEIAYLIGFSSPSYFTTCFTEYYGYPPGEAKHRLLSTTLPNHSLILREKKRLKKRVFIIGSLIIVGLLFTFMMYQQRVPYVNKEGALTKSQDKSIAVLPFENLNLDQDNEYLSVGVVGAINTHLSKISDLRVISQLTVERYWKNSLSAKEIGRDLGALYLLQGSIQRFQSTLRVEMYLIDAITEEQIWAENYDEEINDLLNIQSEIAQKVALELKTKLSSEEVAAIAKNGTENAEAYVLYLKGKYILRTWKVNKFIQSKNLFKQAIALDSGYAQAYVGLAAIYMYSAGVYETKLNPSDAFPLAKPFLDKALTLNPELIEAHNWSGFYYFFGEWDFERAEEEYKTAIATNDPHALGNYAMFLNNIRRHEEALVISEHLNQTSPYYPIARMPLTLYYLGRNDEAIEFAQERRKANNELFTLDTYGFILLNTGNYKKAILQFQDIIEKRDGVRDARVLSWMGAAYARNGEREKAFELIEELKLKRARKEAGSLAFFIAVIYNALDDKEAALQWLEESVKLHEMEVVWLKSEPQLFSLHKEPAFQKLLDKVGFP